MKVNPYPLYIKKHMALINRLNPFIEYKGQIGSKIRFLVSKGIPASSVMVRIETVDTHFGLRQDLRFSIAIHKVRGHHLRYMVLQRLKDPALDLNSLAIRVTVGRRGIYPLVFTASIPLDPAILELGTGPFLSSLGVPPEFLE